MNTTTTRPQGAPSAMPAPPLPPRQAYGFAPTPADDDPSDWRHLSGVNTAARDQAVAYDQACRAIDADPDLSDTGRQKARQRLAAEHAKTLDAQDRMISDAAARLETEGQKIRATLDAKGDELQVMLDLEYRQTLRTMTHEARQAEVLEAINTRNVTKLNAILGALPQSSGLIDSGAGLLHLARRAVVAAAHGDGVHDRLERYGATLMAARQGVDAARDFLKRRAG